MSGIVAVGSADCVAGASDCSAGTADAVDEGESEPADTGALGPGVPEHPLASTTARTVNVRVDAENVWRRSCTPPLYGIDVPRRASGTQASDTIGS